VARRYEITFGFFCRKKPTVHAAHGLLAEKTRSRARTRAHTRARAQVQLLINGEPVLSAINSTSYERRLEYPLSTP
jgi:hypothetical protein